MLVEKEIQINVDIDVLAKLYKVEAKADQNARKDLPKSDAVEPDDVEQDLARRFSVELGRLKVWAEKCFNAQNELRSQINVEEEEKKLYRTIDDLKLGLASARAKLEEQLRRRRATERRHRMDVNAFKLHNRISREAKYPNSMWLHYGAVICIAVTESVLNTYIFAKGNDFGILGGFWEAVLVSVVNVGVAYLAGRFALRHVHHISQARAILGWAGLTFYLSTTILFNLLTGHYRAALETDLYNSVSLAIQTFRDAPLNIASFDAWMLVALGLIASLITLFKSYTEDDPYPGYGGVTRSYEMARDEYDALKQETIDIVTRLVDNHAARIEAVIISARNDIARFEASIRESEATTSRFLTLERDIQAAAAGLIKTYRAANTFIRNTPPPAYFNVSFVFKEDPTHFQKVELDPLDEQHNLYKTALGRMNNAAADLIQKIREAGQKAAGDSRAFFKRIEAEAEKELLTDTETVHRPPSQGAIN